MTAFLSSCYRNGVLRFPWLTLIIMLGILAALLPSIPLFDLDASSDTLLLEKDKDLKKFREVARRYGVKEFLFVTVSPPGDLFAEESLAIVRDLRDEIDALDTTRSVISLLDVPLVLNIDSTLAQIANNFRTLESDDVNIEKARSELLNSPVYRDLVLNPEGTTTALQIFLNPHPEFKAVQERRADLLYKRAVEGLTEAEAGELARVDSEYEANKGAIDEEVHQVVGEIREIMDRHSHRAELHLGGVPMIIDDMITFIRNDLISFGIGVFVFLVVMLGYLFREVRWVVLPLASCVYASLFMIGLLGLAGWKVTVISSNFVSLMLIITMSMNIHLVVRYREFIRDEPDASHQDLVRWTMEHMARPCMYTALTTMIAFASLFFSSIKPVINFGLMMSIGLVVIYITSFTLFPAILLLFPKRELARPESDSYRFTESLGWFTERFGMLVLVLSVAAAAIGISGSLKLEVENSFINYFHKDTEIYQGLKLIDDTLGGTTPLEVVLNFRPPPEVQPDNPELGGADDELAELFGDYDFDDNDDTWFTTEKVDRIKAVHDYLDGLPEVGKVLSLASVLRVAEEVNDGRTFSAFELNVIYKRIPGALKSTMLDPYISIPEDEARISIRIKDSLPDLRRAHLLQKIDAELQSKLGLQPHEYEMTGLLVLYNNMLQSLFQSQIQTLGVVMLGILLMLWFLFRSFTIAVIGVIPNILAASTILGFMGWMQIPLDMMTITIAAITIGIAVDDCIHYLYRYKVEFPERQDYVATMHYCHANIAKAAFYTTITITVGFSILVLSNFIPTILFGLLTAIAMIFALLAALTLMPKLILMLRPYSDF